MRHVCINFVANNQIELTKKYPHDSITEKYLAARNNQRGG